MSTQKNEHNPDNLTPEQYGAPEFRLLNEGEPWRDGDEFKPLELPGDWLKITAHDVEHGYSFERFPRYTLRRRLTPPTDTTGSGREGETAVKPDVIPYLQSQCNRYMLGLCSTLSCMKRGGFVAGVTQDLDYSRATCEYHEAVCALAQLEALRRDGERWQEYRKYIDGELARLRNALFSYALPDEDGRHEIAEKALGPEVLRELRRAAIDSAQRQEGR